MTEVRARRAAAPEVQALEDELWQARAVYKLTNALFNKYERDAAALSRELSRRTTMVPHEARVGKWER